MGISELLSSVTGIGGIGVSLAQWYATVRSEKKKATIDDYLEWLRRKDHQDILNHLISSQESIKAIQDLLNECSKETAEGVDRILLELQERDAALTGEIRAIAKGVEELRRDLALFDSAGVGFEDSSFETEYLSQVANEYGKLQMLGVREMCDLRQQLSIAYVSLAVKRENDDHPERAESILLTEQSLTIRGPAGSGKSTLLSWIAVQCSEQKAAENPWKGGVPFFIPLRRLDKRDSGAPDIQKLLSYTLDPKVWAASPPANWLHRVLSQKRGVLLIDGIDELPVSLRPNFWKWVNDFLARYEGNRIYITSRHFPDTGTGDASLWNPPTSFASAELQEMSDADVAQLIENWHNAILFSEKDLQERLRLEEARDVLPAKLLEPINRRVRELCRSPLLCSLVCALHWREEGYLPSKRVDLYDRCCTMLIEERDLKRNIERPSGPLKYLGLGDKELILQRLALTMMRNKLGNSGKGHQIEITREEAVSWIRPHLTACEHAMVRRCSADDVLNFLIERTGLLRSPAKGLVDFPHRTFQEYLAACAAGALNEAGELVKHAGDDQWHETIILAAGTKAGGIPFGNSLVEQLLVRGEKEKDKRLRHISFALATACLETGRQIRQELRDRVITHLQEIVPPRDHIEARSLSAAGEAVLPYLRYGRVRSRSVSTVAASARTLSLIGTKQAIKSLQEQYGRDRRATVLTEVCECPNVEVLKVPRMLHYLFSDMPGMPISLRRFVKDLTPLVELPSVTQLGLRSLTELSDLSPIADIPGLQRLIIESCWKISDFSPIGRAAKLRDFHLHVPRPDTQLDFLAGCGVQSVCLTRLSGKVDLVPISQIPNLDRLNLNGIESELDVTPLSASNLTTLYLRDVPKVQSIPAISSLTDLELTNMPVKSLDGFFQATLREFDSSRCKSLVDISAISSAPHLKKLYFRDCPAIADFSPLANLQNIEDLILIGCSGLKRLPNLSRYGVLERLVLNGASSLESLDEVAQLSRLRKIALWNCSLLKDFSPLQKLGLKEIVIEPNRVLEIPESLRRICKSTPGVQN
jgi:hypothetical protein